MSHPFGDLLSQHLHRKHGLSQSKLAAGILQEPAIITRMCKGERLTGPQARERVLAIVGWLQQQDALGKLDEANAFLLAAGLAPLRETDPTEAGLVRQLSHLVHPAQPVQKSSFGNFGELLRYLRRRAHLTQDEFGLAVGYSRAHVARLESNQRAPDVAAVQARFIEMLDIDKEDALAALLVALATAAHAEAQADLPREPEQPVTTTHASNNLPIAVTSFIGRDEELAELKRLLPTTKLLTLTGTGGTGKTRLALHLAEAVLATYPDGVWLVPLASLTDPALAMQTVAATLNMPVPHGQGAETAFTARLCDKHLLIVLDNCEHVIDACAQLAFTILRSCPMTQILATSREALGIAGELAWRTPSLQLPRPKARYTLVELRQFAAVQLFVERATFALPTFALTENNMLAVQQICVQLDGIPLAIELAAARMRAMSAETLSERLQDRFRLLTGSGRGVIPRQRTLQALIDWSYGLLTKPERLLLRCLSTFSGGWTLDAAETICAGDGIETLDVLTLLVRLVDKSLVVMSEVTGVTRYYLLETIRQYGVEKLVENGELAHIRERHLTYFMELGKLVETQLHNAGINQILFVRHLATELDNVRHALHWATEVGRIDDGFQLISAFADLFIIRGGQGEYQHWVCQMAEHPITQKNPYQLARLYFEIANIYGRQGDVDQEKRWLDRIKKIGDALNHPEIQSWVLNSLAWNALCEDDYELAKSHLQDWQTLVASHKLISEVDIHLETMMHHGHIALQSGNYAEAKRLFGEIRLNETKLNIGKMQTSATARRLGYALLLNGDHSDALDQFQESLTDNYDLGDHLAVGVCLSAFAMHATQIQDLVRAARLFGASEAIIKSLQVPPMFCDIRQIEPAIASLRQKMDTVALEREWAVGRAMGLEQAIAYCQTA